jgi:hypothetical protein
MVAVPCTAPIIEAAAMISEAAAMFPEAAAMIFEAAALVVLIVDRALTVVAAQITHEIERSSRLACRHLGINHT